MGIFDNATSVTIDGNTVESITIDGATVYEAEPTTANISFTITDALTENALEGAIVTINGVDRTTGSAGGCTFSGIPLGEQAIGITKDGYELITENITVSDGANYTYGMYKLLDGVSVTVKESTTHTPISGASVMIAGSMSSTGSDGVAILDEVPSGDRAIEVEAENYEPYDYIHSIDDDHKSFTIELFSKQQ